MENMKNEYDKNKKKTHPFKIVMSILSFFVIISVVLASAYYINSFSRIKAADTFERDLSREFNAVATNFKSMSLDGIYSVPKIYVIPESAVVAPEPSVSCYGSTSDRSEIEQILEEAKKEGLAKNSDFVWNRNVGGAVKYYFDETICAILWKEKIDECYYNFAEITVAQPSQFRRMLTDDSYGSNNMKTTSSLSEEVNAVVGMSGDFYSHRPNGIVVYHRKLYRNKGRGFQVCYVDSAGDLIFDYNPASKTDAELSNYIEENDILFSLCFGPILADNGKLHGRATGEYVIGEVLGEYARAAIGQVGKLHYLLCTVDGGLGEKIKGTKAMDVGVVMLNKGCNKVYSLDGGQTATIYHNGKVFNRVGYGNQRPISDIIYFATAKPSKKEVVSDEL